MNAPVTPRLDVSSPHTAPAARSAVGSARRADPCTMVILGAGGDLTHRKLLPAIYELAHQRLLSEDFALLGLVRDATTDEQFRDQISDAVASAGPRTD